MKYLQKMISIGSFLLLIILALACSTDLADAVNTPKLAVFWFAASILISGFATGALSGYWPFWPKNMLARVACIFYLWTALCGVIAGLKPYAIPGTVNAAIMGLLVLAWASTSRNEDIEKYSGWIFIASVLVGLYAHLQRLTPAGLTFMGIPVADPMPWNHPHLSQERTISTFGNPNYLADYLVAALPLTFAWVLMRRTAAKRIIALLLWLFTAAAMLLTQTRGAWIACAAAALAWFIINIRSKAQWRGAALKTAGACLALVLLAGSAAAIYQNNHGQSFNIAARVKSFTDLSDLSMRTRLYFWSSNLRTISSHPIFGAGPEGHTVLALQNRDLEPYEVRLFMRNPENAHNQFLQAGSAAGLPGLVLLAACLVLFFRENKGKTDILTAGIICAGIAHWISEFFICSMLPTECIWIFLMAASCVPAKAGENTAPAGLPAANAEGNGKAPEKEASTPAALADTASIAASENVASTTEDNAAPSEANATDSNADDSATDSAADDSAAETAPNEANADGNDAAASTAETAPGEASSTDSNAAAASTASEPAEAAPGADTSDTPEEEPISGLGLLVSAIVILVAFASSSFMLISEYYTKAGLDCQYYANEMADSGKYSDKDTLIMYKTALKYFQKALDTAPVWSQWKAYQHLAFVNDEIFIKVTKEKEMPYWLAANENFQFAHAMDQEQGTPLINLAKLHGRYPDTRERGLEFIEKALAIDPRNPDYLRTKALIYMDLGRNEEASIATDKLLEVVPFWGPALALKGRLLYRLNNFEEGDKYLNAALEVDPAAQDFVNKVKEGKGKF